MVQLLLALAPVLQLGFVAGLASMGLGQSAVHGLLVCLLSCCWWVLRWGQREGVLGLCLLQLLLLPVLLGVWLLKILKEVHHQLRMVDLQSVSVAAGGIQGYDWGLAVAAAPAAADLGGNVYVAEREQLWPRRLEQAAAASSG